MSDERAFTATSRNKSEGRVPRRVAFYGGSFDPVHRGHLAIANELSRIFFLDQFVFVPAFHAPHKKRAKPTPPIHRYAMLALATRDDAHQIVSTIEIDRPENPYTVETLRRLKDELGDTEIFFVIGADSWSQIDTWREWESVLTMTNQIIVTRPGFEIKVDHVSDVVRSRIVDMRGGGAMPGAATEAGDHIYITDAVCMDISAAKIRLDIREGGKGWCEDVTEEVAKYIEKYQIYS